MRDAAAFETLYDRHHRLVYGIALRITGQQAAAEDVTQAIFLKVWSWPEAFDGGNFAAWVGRITRNKSLDALRSKTRHPAQELGDDIEAADVVEEAAFAHLDSVAVKNALACIAPEQRNLIELAYFGGMTQQRIAEKTGVPLGTVKTRIRTGLSNLREALQKAGLP